jgi:hypothetical protein
MESALRLAILFLNLRSPGVMKLSTVNSRATAIPGLFL